MEKQIAGMTGNRVDLDCGHGSIFRGVIRSVADGVIALESDDEKKFYISVEKVVAVAECADSISRPGFIV